MFSAKALYNNVADTPDELSFSKGDVLEVHEKDDNGWWVCSLKGKVGIAPGNRLQIQSAAGSSSRGVSPSGRNSPSTNQVLPSGQKLPPPGSSSVQLGQKSPANDQSVRQNWHLNNKVVVPKKSGNVYVYEPPINQVMQDYDVPPSRHRDIRHGVGGVVGSAQLNQTSGFDSIDALQNYDVPSSLRCSTMQASPDNYDRLPAFTRNTSSRTMERDVLLPPKNASSLIYDIPPAWNASDMSELASNRSSVLSVLSTGSQSSACSGHSSLGGSVSARSSVDVSTHEIYDVPLSSRAMSGAEVGPRQLQTHAEQGMLDGVGGAQSATASSPFAKKDFGKQNSAAGPPCSLKLHVDRDSYLEDYSVPRSDVSQGSGDSGISVSNVDPFGAARPCSDELYDTPRKLVTDAGQRCDQNQSKSEEVTYDVPNQINGRSRDNNNSAVEAGAGLDELSFVGLDDSGARISNPTDILVQLQSTVLGHSSKLVGLISRILSDGGNQGQELSQVKLACLATKTALKEVIDYGNGGLGQALDSSPSSSSKELSEKVFELLDKVHVQLQYLSRHIEKLLTTQWPPRRREKPVFGGGISELDDTLNTIGMLTEAVSGHLQTLTRFVVQNSSSLFKRGSSTATVENGVASRDPNRSTKDDAKCRPPLPPATKAKAKFVGQDSTERPSLATVQERPLPPVPCQASTISVCKFPRLPPSSQMNSALSGTGFEESNSNEWNDDCDYVSIANEAEKEMKVCEKRLDADEPEKPTVGRSMHHGIHKEAVCSGENFSSSSSPERKPAAPSPIGKLKYPTPPVPPSTIPTNPGVAASSGNADHASSISRVGAHENGHAVDSRSLDSQNVAFYVDQSETHFTVVDSAVREFFQMIFNDRVTAKEFLLRSKFVILAAHKLVYIGDTITRNSLHSSSAQNQIAARANNLCDILKETVAATKTSALNFPQNLTQQRLIDCMKAVLQASLQLCEAIRSIAVRV